MIESVVAVVVICECIRSHMKNVDQSGTVIALIWENGKENCLDACLPKIGTCPFQPKQVATVIRDEINKIVV